MSLCSSIRSRRARPDSSGRSNRVLGWACAAIFLLGLGAGFPGPVFGEDVDAQEPVSTPESEVVTRQPTALAQFTTGIEDREPVDQVTFVPNDVHKIFFFSDLRGLTGQTVRHRWIYDGKTMAEVSFEVRGPRWRIWSSKELLPDWIGNWTVEIITANDEVLATETFTYSPPDA